jgi:hypothetical protein
MCLTYFKPLDICVFALVSSISLQVMQQSGIKKMFTEVASYKFNNTNEFIPTFVDVALHKVTGRLLVCLAL